MADEDPDERSNGRLRFRDAVQIARESLESIAGKQPESVSGANRSDDGGWVISFDVVELDRVPSSTDVLATYEVAIDSDGELEDLTRVRRFSRAQASED